MSGTSRWLDRNLGRITVVCVIGTCVCFVGLGWLNMRVSRQASDGSAARVTQCKTRPQAIKKENYFVEIGTLTEKERDIDIAALPSEAECKKLLAER